MSEKKGHIVLHLSVGRLGRSVCRTSNVHSISFDTFCLKVAMLGINNEFDFDFQIEFKVTWSKVKVKLLILEKCLCWKVATLATVNAFRVDDPC